MRGEIFRLLRQASAQYSTGIEATGGHTQFSAVILTLALFGVASSRFNRGTVLGGLWHFFAHLDPDRQLSDLKAATEGRPYETSLSKVTGDQFWM